VQLVSRTNEHGQPIGADLGAWRRPPRPPRQDIRGRTVTLEPLDRARHERGLFEAFGDSPASMWTYLPYGPFSSSDALGEVIDAITQDADRVPFAVVVDDRPLGFLTFLRIDRSNGVIEIGSIAYSHRLQRTTAATEAIVLLIGVAFDLGYRRCEWKCDSLNAKSRAAAERLGFQYEGTFRQATQYKGRNRDTAWFAILDVDWPARQQAFRAWLSPANFDSSGRQRRPLRGLA
jgi:RimJ/RimL family protein N-acetyltransferase